MHLTIEKLGKPILNLTQRNLQTSRITPMPISFVSARILYNHFLGQSLLKGIHQNSENDFMNPLRRFPEASNYPIDRQRIIWYIKSQAKVHCDFAQTDFIPSFPKQITGESVFFCNQKQLKSACLKYDLLAKGPYEILPYGPHTYLGYGLKSQPLWHLDLITHFSNNA